MTGWKKKKAFKSIKTAGRALNVTELPLLYSPDTCKPQNITLNFQTVRCYPNISTVVTHFPYRVDPF